MARPRKAAAKTKDAGAWWDAHVERLHDRWKKPGKPSAPVERQYLDHVRLRGGAVPGGGHRLDPAFAACTAAHGATCRHRIWNADTGVGHDEPHAGWHLDELRDVILPAYDGPIDTAAATARDRLLLPAARALDTSARALARLGAAGDGGSHLPGDLVKRIRSVERASERLAAELRAQVPPARGRGTPPAVAMKVLEAIAKSKQYRDARLCPKCIAIALTAYLGTTRNGQPYDARYVTDALLKIRPKRRAPARQK